MRAIFSMRVEAGAAGDFVVARAGRAQRANSRPQILVEALMRREL
jgi:hypothetical protein